MRTQISVLLITASALVGCDRISGVEEQKTSDAEAIGYACRVSQKAPEACMKENEAQSPTSILAGWKSADKDIQEEKIDPSMGKRALSGMAAQSEPAAAESEASAVPGENAGGNSGEAATEKPAEKNGGTKGGKTAETRAKPAKAETEKKPTSH